MRIFYKYTDEDGVEHVTEVMEGMQQTMPLSDVEALVDSGDALLYDTHDELDETIQYKTDRSIEYPKIEDQLDKMYHDGFDAWKETIKAVKDANPKPE